MADALYTMTTLAHTSSSVAEEQHFVVFQRARHVVPPPPTVNRLTARNCSLCWIG